MAHRQTDHADNHLNYTLLRWGGESLFASKAKIIPPVSKSNRPTEAEMRQFVTMALL
jgi:hypothetical protein